MNDSSARAPLFFQAAHPGSTAISAHFERVPHPRASAPPGAAPQLHAAPIDLPPHNPPANEAPAHARAPAGPANATLAPSPPTLFHANPPLPPALSSEPPRPVASLVHLEEAIANLRLHASRLAEQARSDAMEIGFQVARRILETELSTSPEPLFALVRSAVRRVGDARKLVIKLHPGDASRIDDPEARAKLGLSLLQVEVVADASLSPGDAVVETDTATVDGRLATRIDEVRRAVSLTVEENPL